MCWHKGKKNQCFGIDAQIYLNEAHEKVKNLKIYAFLKVKKKISVCLLTRVCTQSACLSSNQCIVLPLRKGWKPEKVKST